MLKKYIIALLAVCVSTQACSAESQTIKVGVIAPLSGPFSAIGKEVVDGITLAAQEVTDKVHNITPQIIIEDDHYEPSAGITAFKKLTSVDKVTALLNLSSPTIGAIYPLLKRNEMPVIQFGEQTEEPSDDTVFQMSPGSMEGFKQFGVRTKARHEGNAVVLAAEDATISRFVSAFQQGFGDNIEIIEVPASTEDMQPFIVKALLKKPTWIVPFLMPNQAAPTINRLTARAERPLLAIPFMQVSFEDYKRLLPHMERLKDDFTCAFPDPDPEFKSRFLKKFGYVPGSWGGFGYDGLVVLLGSYSKDQRTWLLNIAAFHGQGVSGVIGFDKVGVRNPIFDTLSVGDYVDQHK